MNNLYIDVHVIQTVPPSCLNRDDTGSPKTAIYGGVRRARVSSQAWKHAMRTMFKKHFDERGLGMRTKKIVECVAKAIQSRDPSKEEAEANLLARKIVEAADIQLSEVKAKKGDAKGDDAEKGKENDSKALIFISKQQVDSLAELALTTDFGWIDTLKGKEKEEEEKRVKAKLKKPAQAALSQNGAIDIALFGRMVADAPILNSDASAQVAHAISTHKIANEFDFYTAVDDCSREDTKGAGMLGTIEFNSSTLYRYATVAVHELYRQLAGDMEMTKKVAAEFVRAFVQSMPPGRINPFANYTEPNAVYVALRDDHPVNLVCAFENPVEPVSGYVDASIERLGVYAKRVYESFASKPKKAYFVTSNVGKDKFGDNVADTCNINKLLECIQADVQGGLQ